MKKNIHIVTDSTGYIPEDFLKENPFVHVVPLTVNFEDCSIVDHLDNNKEFMEKLEKCPKLPTTSRPSPEKFAQVFKEILDEGGEVICIAMTSKLSGTYESALVAKNKFKGDKINVIDSKTTVSGLFKIIKEAVKLIKEGKDRQEIVEVVEDLTNRVRIYLVPKTLEYLKKGGRIGGAQAFLGTLMKIKPILFVEDGGVIAFDKVRTTKKVYQRLIKEIGPSVKEVSVGHFANEEEAKKLKEMLLSTRNNINVTIEEIGPVIAVHTGPYAIGTIFIE